MRDLQVSYLQATKTQSDAQDLDLDRIIDVLARDPEELGHRDHLRDEGRVRMAQRFLVNYQRKLLVLDLLRTFSIRIAISRPNMTLDIDPGARLKKW